MKNKILTYLKEVLRDTVTDVPDSFVDFWIDHYGAKVKKIILDKNDKEWRVDKVLTVDEENEVAPKPISWRNGSSPEALDYSVLHLESIFSNWEEHEELIPFAGIDSLESTAYDLLVLNFLETTVPKVSVWVHEQSFGYEEPYLIDVADSFEDFLAKWNASK